MKICFSTAQIKNIINKPILALPYGIKELPLRKYFNVRKKCLK
jgi:hypothetical protein